MKTMSYVMLVTGVVMMIGGCFIFGHINTVNAVDSHVWGINLNGIRSFQWPVFLGFVIFMLGVIYNMATMKRLNMYEK